MAKRTTARGKQKRGKATKRVTKKTKRLTAKTARAGAGAVARLRTLLSESL